MRHALSEQAASVTKGFVVICLSVPSRAPSCCSNIPSSHDILAVTNNDGDCSHIQGLNSEQPAVTRLMVNVAVLAMLNTQHILLAASVKLVSL
jgi:hypothetical protein